MLILEVKRKTSESDDMRKIISVFYYILSKYKDTSKNYLSNSSSIVLVPTNKILKIIDKSSHDFNFRYYKNPFNKIRRFGQIIDIGDLTYSKLVMELPFHSKLIDWYNRVINYNIDLPIPNERKDYRSLFRDIQANGYKCHILHNKKPYNEIEIAINHDEELYFIDGRHRLVIARILKIELVYVIINVIDLRLVERYKREHNVYYNPSPQQLISWLLNMGDN